MTEKGFSSIATPSMLPVRLLSLHQHLRHVVWCAIPTIQIESSATSLQYESGTHSLSTGNEAGEFSDAQASNRTYSASDTHHGGHLGGGTTGSGDSQRTWN